MDFNTSHKGVKGGNRKEKCVICLFSKSRLIAYDLKQFYENRKLIEEKVNQIRDKIDKYNQGQSDSKLSVFQTLQGDVGAYKT